MNAEVVRLGLGMCVPTFVANYLAVHSIDGAACTLSAADLNPKHVRGDKSLGHRQRCWLLQLHPQLPVQLAPTVLEVTSSVEQMPEIEPC